MEFDIITIFPEMIKAFLNEGIVSQGIKKGIISINVHNLRDFTNDKHRLTDDYGYGGGPGMVMLIEPIVKAIEGLKRDNTHVVLTSPKGNLWSQAKAKQYSNKKHIIIICGRYKGVDERIKDYIDEEISIGDFVLSGGEIAASIIVDSTVRLIDGVMSDIQSAKEDSFYKGRLSFPVYTRPAVFRDKKVPDVLLSGNHKLIELFRKRESLKLTMERRPDLFEKFPLNEEEKKILKDMENIKEVNDES